MVIYRPTTPSPHVKQFKRNYDKVVTASERKSEALPHFKWVDLKITCHNANRSL